MHVRMQCESDSTDSSDNEYCAYSQIKPKWLEDYTNGNFGDDFPPNLGAAPKPQPKVNGTKAINVPTNLIQDILKKVRRIQHEQTPNEPPSATQQASTKNTHPNNMDTQSTVHSNETSNFVQNGAQHVTPRQENARENNVTSRNVSMIRVNIFR